METVIDTVPAYTLEVGDHFEHNGIQEVMRIEDGRHGDRGLVYVYLDNDDLPLILEAYDDIDLIGWVYED